MRYSPLHPAQLQLHCYSASVMVMQLNLDNLKLRRIVDKAILMYKVMHGLVDLHPLPGLFKAVSGKTCG